MIYIAFLVFLLVFLGLLAATETAFFSLSPFTVRSYKLEGDKRKRLIANLLDNPKELLVTILILSVLVEVLIQNTMSDLVGPKAGLLLKVGLPLVLTLFLGEIIPKSLALSHNRSLSYKSVQPLSFVYRLLGPIRWLFTYVTSYISRFFFFFLKKENPLSNEELKHILASSIETGVLNKEEKELISGYLNLKEAQIREKMSLKKEIVFFDIKRPLSELVALFENYSVLPLVDGGLDNVLGLITIKDYFFREEIHSSQELKNLVQKPLYVPEWASAYDLLLRFKKENKHLALAVDEYGSISGLITQEDLLEEVIGKIDDGKEKKLYYHPSKDVIIASGVLELRDFFKIFNKNLGATMGATTLGGFLTHKLREIPCTGTKYITNGFLFYVLEASPTKIKTVYVRRLKDV